MPDNSKDLLQIDASQWITWILVFFGWLVINYQHNKREDRKELRAIVDDLKNRIYSLEERAVQYHCTNEVKLSESNQIKLDIQRLISDIRLQGLFSSEQTTKIFKDLRRAITLNNFESATHKALPSDHLILSEIHESIDELIELIETTFRARYPLQQK